MMTAEIRRVSAADTRGLRQALLRQNATPDELVYPGDDDPLTAHFAAYDADGQQVGIASVYQQPPRPGMASADDADDAGVWRLRAMATRPDIRGTGVGGRLLEVGIGYVAAHGGTLLWCDARVAAVGFYERYGFATRGDVYDVPRVGPHLFMQRRISADDAALLAFLSA